MPNRYDSLKETLKYSREAIRVDEIASTARSKEMEYKEAPSSRTTGEGNFVRVELRVETLTLMQVKKRIGQDPSQEKTSVSAGSMAK